MLTEGKIENPARECRRSTSENEHEIYAARLLCSKGGSRAVRKKLKFILKAHNLDFLLPTLS